jgi:hypothetical protein
MVQIKRWLRLIPVLLIILFSIGYPIIFGVDGLIIPFWVITGAFLLATFYILWAIKRYNEFTVWIHGNQSSLKGLSSLQINEKYWEARKRGEVKIVPLFRKKDKVDKIEPHM